MGDEGKHSGGVMVALIVNDDPSTCDMLRLVLEDEGKFIVETAYDGQEGLTALRRSHGPHVLVLDDIMPFLDGEEVLEALAADPLLAQRTTVVFLTARSDPLPPRLKRLLTDFNAQVLSYGFDMGVFLRVVEEAVSRLPPR